MGSCCNRVSKWKHGNINGYLFPAHTVFLSVKEEGDGLCANNPCGWCIKWDDPHLVSKLEILQAELGSMYVGGSLCVIKGAEAS